MIQISEFCSGGRIRIEIMVRDNNIINSIYFDKKSIPLLIEALERIDSSDYKYTKIWIDKENIIEEVKK